MAQLNDFLNPKSMLTPGAAGSLMWTITTTLAHQFPWVNDNTALVALLTSSVFGLLVFGNKRIPFWERMIYYVLNSLIIFCVGVGANIVGGGENP